MDRWGTEAYRTHMTVLLLQVSLSYTQLCTVERLTPEQWEQGKNGAHPPHRLDVLYSLQVRWTSPTHNQRAGVPVCMLA